MKNKAEIIIAMLMALVVASCSGKPKKEGSGRIVTVTIEPQRYFARAIAGERFTIRTMVPQGSSPETYDPTPRQLVGLNESEAYLRIGHIGFEVSWMKRLQENTPGLKVFDLSKGIDLIRETGHAHDDHHHPGGIDPHLWNSAANARVIAQNILNAFAELDPQGKDYYRARYDSLVVTINRTDSTIRSILQDGADRAFMIYHPALSYFAREYGLHQISIEEGGKEPSPSHLKNLIELAKLEHVNVIFVQPEFDKRNAEVIAGQTHTRIVAVNPLAYDWQEEMLRIAESLKNKE